jgi:hypothetical protein
LRVFSIRSWKNRESEIMTVLLFALAVDVMSSMVSAYEPCTDGSCAEDTDDFVMLQIKKNREEALTDPSSEDDFVIDEWEHLDQHTCHPHSPVWTQAGIDSVEDQLSEDEQGDDFNLNVGDEFVPEDYAYITGQVEDGEEDDLPGFMDFVDMFVEQGLLECADGPALNQDNSTRLVAENRQTRVGWGGRRRRRHTTLSGTQTRCIYGWKWAETDKNQKCNGESWTDPNGRTFVKGSRKKDYCVSYCDANTGCKGFNFRTWWPLFGRRRGCTWYRTQSPDCSGSKGWKGYWKDPC